MKTLKLLTSMAFSVIALLAAASGAGAEITVPPIASAECTDGVDNDGDLRFDITYDDVLDEYQGDPGCRDDTPSSEAFTGPLWRLSANKARSHAKEVTEHKFGSAYTNGFYEQLKCMRITKYKFGCVIAWAFRTSIYIARIWTYNYLDLDEKKNWYGYRLRGWKVPPRCWQREDFDSLSERELSRCASKRYLVR